MKGSQSTIAVNVIATTDSKTQNEARSSYSTNSEQSSTTKRKDLSFWMILFSLCLSMFCSALELTAVPSAMPTMTAAIHGVDFVWVNSAFSLASTSLIPTTGGLADIFGRQSVILSSFFFFALGSALCGSAQNMPWLVAGRALQGVGSGGIQSLTMIILSDLVSLQERARYNGFIGLVWAISATCGPLIGGGFAKSGNWRWLFYINLPLSGLCATLIVVFLRLRTPSQSLKEKLLRIDWIGNILIVSSSASVVIGLSYGGVKYPWSSANVVVPLVLGFIGMAVFVAYECLYAPEPIIPMRLLSNRTSVSGYIQTFITSLIVLSFVIFQPAYFQACFGFSPIHSGALLVPASALLGITLILASVSVTITKKYRPQLFIGWVLFVIGCGMISSLKYDSSIPKGFGFPMFSGVAGGIMFALTYFPVLAPLPVSENAHALALFAFFRSFAGVWAISIGSTILDNTISRKLSPDILSMFPGGASGVYFSIPILSSIPDPARTEIRIAFADGISLIWEVLIGFAIIGLLSCFLMKGLPLHTELDKKWGLEHGEELVTRNSSDTNVTNV
ncbi:MFS transporter superfamily protein [Abortiporus biennis]